MFTSIQASFSEIPFDRQKNAMAYWMRVGFSAFSVAIFPLTLVHLPVGNLNSNYQGRFTFGCLEVC
jgi:hypothetical protein